MTVGDRLVYLGVKVEVLIKLRGSSAASANHKRQAGGA